METPNEAILVKSDGAVAPLDGPMSQSRQLPPWLTKLLASTPKKASEEANDDIEETGYLITRHGEVLPLKSCPVILKKMPLYVTRRGAPRNYSLHERIKIKISNILGSIK
jgi:hypothetical protein